MSKTKEPASKKFIKSRNKIKKWLERLKNFFPRDPQNKSELIDVLHYAEDRKIVNTEMIGMIERILHVSDMQVREIMVPKADMIVLDVNQPLKKILPLVIESGHSRFPVYNMEHQEIVGILLAKDLLKFVFNQNDFEIKKFIRPALFIPQNKRLDVLLREFRINRNHLAIVMDEYGHASGLVTIEDVLEQIVGEIEDEYDIDEPDTLIKKIDDQTFIVKANASLIEFNDYFHTIFDHEGLDKIGDFIQYQFQHLPRRNEAISLAGLRFKILHSDNHQIYLIEVKIIYPML